MKKIAALTLALFLSYGMALADSPKDSEPQPPKPAAPAKPKAAKKAEKPEAALASEVEELRQAVQAQQEELQLLKEELAKRDRQIDAARDAAAAASARASEASTKATEAVKTTDEVKTTAATLNSTVADIKASNEALKTTVEAEHAAGGQAGGEEGPASWRFKGITVTPGGYLAAESVWRQRSAQADINTPFTGTPFPGNDLSKVSEFNASGRQSRLSFLFEGKADNVKLNGYYELDWLGACATSNNRQSNSYCLRQRQIWGQAALSSGWSFTGGQMWSLATETRKGLDNRTEATPLTIDAQYNVGFTWERQYGFRVVKNFNDKFWFGFSVEGPQSTLTAHGQPTQFFVGAPGASGGLFNATDGTGYSTNITPDFIVKAAYEPGFGHYELFGIIRDFRARVYPCSAAVAIVALPAGCPGVAPSAGNAFNDTRAGGGVGFNARFPIVPNKKGELGIHFLGGDGIGRYSSAQIADLTARPNGTLAPIRGGSALGTLELHPGKFDVYFNYGVEFSARAAYIFNNATTGAPVAVGFGSPLFNNSGCEAAEPLPTAPFTTVAAGGCNADLRNIQEATFGFWHKIYNGPKGGVRWGLQYSYLTKNSWSGNNNTPAVAGVNAKGVDNMFFTSFRYYIP